MAEDTDKPLLLIILLERFGLNLLGALRDLLPIILVITVFQLAVLQRPFSELLDILLGGLLVIFGLAFFVIGLEIGLFPIGEGMAHAFARKGSLVWLLIFSFFLGFTTTVAEPALIAVTKEAAKAAAEASIIPSREEALGSYAMGLRLTVALSVGIAVVVGVIRILRGWPVHYLIIGAYVIVILMTTVAPQEIVGIAYDSGGVTTSTVTVPLVAALGVGLASSIRERNPLVDGFGLIAFASLLPIVFVMAYGLIVFG